MNLTHTKSDGTVLSATEATVYCLEEAKKSLKSDAAFWDLAIEAARETGLEAILLFPSATRIPAVEYLENAAQVSQRPFAALFEQFCFFPFEVLRPGQILRYGANEWKPQA